MPMRGPLPLRNSSPNTFSAAANLKAAILSLLETPDFTVIVALASAGTATSWKLALAYPPAMEAVALFAQTT